jgi:hypothetical protein
MKNKSLPVFVWIAIVFFGGELLFSQTARHSISGFVYEKGSRETLPGVNVYLPDQRLGTTTNNYGFYSITLPAGSYQVAYSMVGFTVQAFEIALDKDINLDVFLIAAIELKGVEIVGEKRRR